MKAWKLGYKKTKDKAMEIYKKIGRISCPALNDDHIYFNRLGFNHIVRKGRITRTKNEQKRRFILLKYAEDIIRNPKAFIKFREYEIKERVNRHGEKILVTFNSKFWTFTENREDCKIKLVVRQNDGSNKHFFSIMGDNVQIDKNKKGNKKIPQ